MSGKNSAPLVPANKGDRNVIIVQTNDKGHPAVEIADGVPIYMDEKGYFYATVGKRVFRNSTKARTRTEVQKAVAEAANVVTCIRFAHYSDIGSGRQHPDHVETPVRYDVTAIKVETKKRHPGVDYTDVKLVLRDGKEHGWLKPEQLVPLTPELYAQIEAFRTRQQQLADEWSDFTAKVVKEHHLTVERLAESQRQGEVEVPLFKHSYNLTHSKYADEETDDDERDD